MTIQNTFNEIKAELGKPCLNRESLLETLRGSLAANDADSIAGARQCR